MRLSREAIQRMVGNTAGGGSTGGGGSIDITQMLSGYATQEWTQKNYLSIEFFNRLFAIHASNSDLTQLVQPNDMETTITSIEAMFGFWTEQYLSALGKNDAGGGGGTGDVTWALLASPAQEGRYIDASYITGALSGYATQQWVQQQGYVTPEQLALLEFVNSITGTDGVLTFGTNKGTQTIVDLSHEHTFQEILDRPTTMKGYGITDAMIENGVIMLAGNTITPITSLSMTVPTGLSISGSPITKSGTLALSYASGYEGFATSWKNDIRAKVDLLFSMFELDQDGNIKTKDYTDGSVTKHRGFWSESFVSALGKNAAGGGGTGDVTWALLAAPAQEGRYIDRSYITGALSGYATEEWVNNRGFATQVWVQNQNYATQAALSAMEYLNSITGDYGFVTFGTNKGNITTIDFTHDHTFQELLDRPTTVKGYGITDIPAWAMAANKPSYNLNEIGGVLSTSQMPASGVPAGTYKSVTVDTYGRVTAGSNPDTIAEYGIMDAFISDGVITLGNNTITPITSLSMTVPTGLSISGSPITKSGTLALSYANGYEGFATSWKNDIRAKVDLLFSMFELDQDGNIKTKDYTDGGVTKHRGIWSESFVSAMGKNAGGGGGGTGDVTWALLAAPAQEGRYIDASYITGALSGYATQSWVLGLGYATQAALNALEFVNSITGDNGIVIFGTNKGNSTVIDFTHEHTFAELLDRPTTVKGYGITDIPAWAMAANKPSYSFGEISGVAGANQIPTLDWSKIGTGKPTTLAGYGITDACTQATANSLLYSMSHGSDGVLNVATLGGTSKYDIDFSHEHTFLELLDRPTTFGGYGITGGTLSDHLYVMGNVGIGTDSPTHRLTVNGDASLHYLRTYGVNIRGPQNYIDFYYAAATAATTRIFEESAGTLCVVGNIYSTQGVSALYTSNVSDIRKKDVLSDINLSVESVANAPSVRFLWKGQHELGEQVGSIAQYWQKALPQSVIDKDGELSLQYGVAALLSSIATAKKVVNHEQRIKELEAENERLRTEIENLKIA